MDTPELGRWQDIDDAPRDGSRVLVEVRASEQGPAEIDVARWAKPDQMGEECWISADSDPALVVFYADAELSGWMPLPTPLPELRATRKAQATQRNPSGIGTSEIEGSGI